MDRLKAQSQPLPVGPSAGQIVRRCGYTNALRPYTADDDPLYRDWLDALAPWEGEPALEFLTRLNAAIHDQFLYAVRAEPGAQSPARTLSRNIGSCRDFAWLMIESDCRFGFAARFATGYLFCPGATVRGAGANLSRHLADRLYSGAPGRYSSEPGRT